MKMKSAGSGKTMSMRGFMCQSSSTAVCMAGGGNSVIVPLSRRPLTTTTLAAHDDNTRLLATSATRLVHHSHHHSFSTTTTTTTVVSNSSKIRSPVSVPCSLKRDQAAVSHDKQPKLIQIDPPSSLPSSDNVFQVVVMRVSLHCQGCAGKVKKHLSKMEGVTSFSIDLEDKRVTVMGHISPIGVLESISKVKKAEFWPC
ncbi:protein SODIUM POTASSIUM ROOT DEFECTIVE 1-like [Tripterygium wilfordii]|uniref:protein SODIUM POTASSIUM ROOT DEFECTIVE 1-like n=1 Tax=Tripterygium wilfordii TaxID=458696 RepID=UPI0018F83DF1|nr:protein SODIUM POTASSIUM ROOT DEFECTIVE 1-like [Tripterygium wilfordii]